MDDDTSRTAQALELFAAVCELAGAARAAELDRLCDDPLVRAEVEALFAADEGRSLDVPSPEQILGALDDEHPRTFGDFEVLELLGRGGMGTVYRARQSRPERIVALKVLGGRGMSSSARRRFELEVELLGRLDHEGIARIHAAGTEETSGGECPWFAMEFVDGVLLLDHARGLSRDERLGLFLDVCDAVEHAHRHGVIHRDIKNANVLVSRDGAVKVLDFGIARSASEVTSSLTLDGQIVGTLATMSPEQARGDSLIDTRSDVYSLGVLLHQLLVDALPIDVRDVAVTEALRRIVEARPQSVSSSDATLAGDLDVIVATSLEKEPGARYGSVGELADDVRRHLAHMPILAAPPDTLDRVARFVRRHRLLVAAGVVLVVGLAAAALVSFSYWRDAEGERAVAEGEREAAEQARSVAQTERRAADDARGQAEHEREVADAARVIAERERDRIEQLYQFVRSTFSSIDPNVAQGDVVTVREIVDDAAAELWRSPPEDPALSADMHALLGEVYMNLTLATQGVEHYRHVIKLADEHGAGVASPGVLARTHYDLATSALMAADQASAERHYERLESLAGEYVELAHFLPGALYGRAQLTGKPPAERLEFIDRALALIDAEDESLSSIRFSNTRAEILGELERAEEAMTAANEAVASAEAAERPGLVVQALLRRSHLYAGRGDRRALDDGARISSIVDEVLGVAHPQGHAFVIDVAYQWMVETGEVHETFRPRMARAAQDLAREPGNVNPFTWAYLGVLCNVLGDFGSIALCCEHGLAPFASQLDGDASAFDATTQVLVALLLEQRLELAYRVGDDEAAIRDGERLEALDASHDPRAHQMLTLAIVRAQGFDAALEHSARVTTELRAAGKLTSAARSELVIGLAASEIAGQGDVAIAALMRGVEDLGDVEADADPNLAKALLVLGSHHQEAGDASTALAFLERLRDPCEGLEPDAHAEALGRLARANLALAAADPSSAHARDALADFERAVERRRAITPLRTAAAATDLMHWAVALRQLGHEAASTERFDEALALVGDDDWRTRAEILAARDG